MTPIRTFTIALSAGLALAAAPAAADAVPTTKLPERSLCRPVPVKTFHGTRMEAYCRLARITNGTVACVTLNTAKPRRCAFTPSSGEWLVSTNGDLFAVADQQISRDGAKGGDYVVAARLGKDGRPPCAKDNRKPKATISDAAGTAAGTDFGGGCIVEVSGSPDNRNGQPIHNFASLDVCSSTSGSLDQRTAVFTGSPEPGVYCYRGEGAGMNDVNGTERDAAGRRIQGSPCHTIWSGGYEIAASKRPAVRSYPAPGAVDPKTPVLWRPVTSVRVAN
jgi:hypothetical protein